MSTVTYNKTYYRFGWVRNESVIGNARRVELARSAFTALAGVVRVGPLLATFAAWTSFDLPDVVSYTGELDERTVELTDLDAHVDGPHLLCALTSGWTVTLRVYGAEALDIFDPAFAGLQRQFISRATGEVGRIEHNGQWLGGVNLSFGDSQEDLNIRLEVYLSLDLWSLNSATQAAYSDALQQLSALGWAVAQRPEGMLAGA